MLAAMPAKKKSKGRSPRRTDDPIPDISDILRLHMEASRHRDALLEEARQLQIAGKVREARKLLSEAVEIQTRLRALEEGVRKPNPHGQQ
jgi:hypothetical protein